MDIKENLNNDEVNNNKGLNKKYESICYHKLTSKTLRLLFYYSKYSHNQL